MRRLIVLLVEIAVCSFYSCLGFTFQGVRVASVLPWWRISSVEDVMRNWDLKLQLFIKPATVVSIRNVSTIGIFFICFFFFLTLQKYLLVLSVMKEQ